MGREQAERHVGNAWKAAAVSGTLTVIVALTGVLGLGPWLLFDAAIILLLAYGIYRQSMRAAIAMVAYWLFNFFVFVLPSGGAGFVLSLVFGYFYAQGVRGAIELQRLKAAERSNEYWPPTEWPGGNP